MLKHPQWTTQQDKHEGFKSSRNLFERAETIAQKRDWQLQAQGAVKPDSGCINAMRAPALLPIYLLAGLMCSSLPARRRVGLHQNP